MSGYHEAYAAAKAAPVKLAEMIEIIDTVAGRSAASQQALVASGLRADCHPGAMREIVALETAMEILAAAAADRQIAEKLSKAVATMRKEFA